jgi:hypothetical protein
MAENMVSDLSNKYTGLSVRVETPLQLSIHATADLHYRVDGMHDMLAWLAPAVQVYKNDL